MKVLNPFAFSPGPVIFWTTITYIAIAIPLIYIHETVPPAPANDKLPNGVSLDDAWADLQEITKGYHPYNSRNNDAVRQYLFDRAEQILQQNNAQYSVEAATNTRGWDYASTEKDSGARVAIFDDMRSNFTMSEKYNAPKGTDTKENKNAGYYFEGTNLYIYIRGEADPPGKWWNKQSSHDKAYDKGGVLVNCHYDSVSTGYGATDDGMACVSMLQLLSYFTHADSPQPKNGIVLLFNNEEEDGLWGARAFGTSPVQEFCHTFVNLEGAGAGGRVMMFRATDLEVAKAYSHTPYPFGSVLAADAFKRGLIRSRTDYEVFNEAFGQRGMDVAFYAPRSRYHTIEDDTRHTSVRSIWHMLSAALASTQSLSQDTGSVFRGDRSDSDESLVQNGKRTSGVYFDLFGTTWVTFALKGLFAWTLTLLVATPLIIVTIGYLISSKDKWYFFARDIKLDSNEIDEPISIGGWKGFIRFPLAFVLAVSFTFGSALLVAKINPLIVYSSIYSTWAMYISIFYSIFWLIVRGASFVRPTVLHRGFALLWIFFIGWGLQVFSAVFEDRSEIGAVFPLAFFQTGAFLALLIALLEQLALPGKREYALQHHNELVIGGPDGRDGPNHPAQQEEPEEDDDEDAGSDAPGTPTETTPLRSGERAGQNETTFGNTYRQSIIEAPMRPLKEIVAPQAYENEQTWSGGMPTWTWFFQFLLLAPLPLIILGNLGLMATSSSNMGAVDGMPPSLPLMLQAGLVVMLLLPLTPFLHRVTHHVPVFLFLAFGATLVYNLTRFPFSTDHRFKFYFQQRIDLDQNTSFVNLTGIQPYIQSVVDSIPAARGQNVVCHDSQLRLGLSSCAYAIKDADLEPHFVKGKDLKDLMSLSKRGNSSDSKITVSVNAYNTRQCKLEFDRTVSSEFSVEDGAEIDARFATPPRAGIKRIELYRRDWDAPWNVTFSWSDKKSTIDGSERSQVTTFGADHDELKTRSNGVSMAEITLTCLWADANKPSTIPTYTQLLQYMPTWAVASKTGAGLVEVKKRFHIAA